MRYCVNCGKSTDESEKFCKYCGTEKRETIQQTNTNQMGTNSSYNNFSPSKKKKRTFLIFLLWVLFFPIMVIVTIAKSEKIKTPTKIILIFIIVVICLVIIAPSDNKYVEKSISESETIIYFEEIADKELRDDFIAACSQIGMDLDKVNNLCQVDDWVGGLRYSFAYENMAMRIYCNMDSTVNTVKLGADTDLYKQGYESYQIDDYIVDDSAETNLIMISEDVVKLQLNYPSTAKFSIFGWSFGRNRKLYFVTNQVTAQNAFGVEEELLFSITYEVVDEKANVKYFILNGGVIVDEMDSVIIPERQKLLENLMNGENQEINLLSDGFRLVDGQIGIHGKTDVLNGREYINYYIPMGTYKVTSNIAWCKVYLDKDKTIMNAEGYSEYVNVVTLEFSESDETQMLTVSEGEHIALTQNAIITLVPME